MSYTEYIAASEIKLLDTLCEPKKINPSKSEITTHALFQFLFQTREENLKNFDIATLLKKNQLYINALIDLIHRGADLNATNHQGRTPLHVLALKRNLAFAVVLLIDNKDAVNVKDSFGFTPLQLAVHNQREETAKALILAGAEDPAPEHLTQEDLDRLRKIHQEMSVETTLPSLRSS